MCVPVPVHRNKYKYILKSHFEMQHDTHLILFLMYTFYIGVCTFRDLTTTTNETRGEKKRIFVLIWAPPKKEDKLT